MGGVGPRGQGIPLAAEAVNARLRLTHKVDQPG